MNVIPGWGPYSAAKAALNKLTEILAGEEPALTALALRPGIVDTTMQTLIRERGRGRMAESNYNRLASMSEQGRLRLDDRIAQWLPSLPPASTQTTQNRNDPEPYRLALAIAELVK